ncbi:non-ribosomal peptide synthetase [Streptomyces liangshanensis]|uniref:Amino acid adenylation domain-containing protein n=1 Tax=Streptomyces liangshanensis TaxID=2717324 RepID=A0A6G9GW05_9ACTN|nr:non-ribosomal peptide synthetase [Streptomyces liangshanensis]QIQ02256.1 amino acid adenylation domain-containing protein [Streptomyces liangshanensis]
MTAAVDPTPTPSQAPAPTPPGRHTTDHPLTVDQRRLWFLQQLDPTDTGYHLYLVRRWRGPLDVPALRGALDALTARHEILRTRFVVVGDGPRQVVDPPTAVPLVRHDVSPAGEDDVDRLLTEAVAPHVNTPFDLAAGPPLRAVLVRAGEDEHALCLVLHHIAGDGWSSGVLWHELLTLYGAALTGSVPQLPALALQYGDHARAEEARLGPDEQERAYAHWRDRLAGAEPLRLPRDRPRPAEPLRPAGFADLALGPELTAAVDQLARQERCTPFMVLLTAYQAVLGRWCGQDDFTVGTPLAGRPDVAHEALIGYFTRTAVIRADLRGDAGRGPDFRTVLRRVRSATMGALAHQDVPLERLAADLGEAPGGLPFRTLFVLQSQHETGGGAAEPELPAGVTLLSLDSGFARAKADLLLDTWRTEAGLTCSFSYDEELFDRSTVETLARRYRTLLTRATADPLLPVHGDWLLDAEERAAVLARGTGPGVDPGRRTVLARFAEQVALRPDAPALALGEGTLSYAELDRRSSLLAARIGPVDGGVAAVRIPPSYALVTALLAVWKAGGGYLPLDEAYPLERLRQLVADGGARLLITAGEGPDLGIPSLAVPTEWPDGATVPSGASQAGPESGPAYVLFTSGSTGRPKGVVVEQGALADRVAWMTGTAATGTAGAQGYGLRPGDRIVQFASLGFDTHAEEIWPALASGACCVLLPGGSRTLPDVLRSGGGAGVTVLDLPTAYWHELVLMEDEFTWPADLRLVVLGGSAVDGTVLARWHARHGGRIRLVNTYGPTEATVIATSADLTLPSAPPGAVVARPPIGRPLAGVRCYVLDERLGLVPDGTEGELFLGGRGLARGYAGRAGLTAERFLPDPFAADGTRMYRTGDRVRRLPDGELEFLGRTDGQVKLRGYRIEPGEVEHALTAHPAVAHALVAVREGRLLGYVVPAPGATPVVPELLAHLEGLLPAFMVPSGLAVLDRLPLTVNGKPDVSALPLPGPAVAAPAFVPPRTDAEALVAELWEEVLGVERVGARDDFFSLGGDSLRVTRVAARIRSVAGLEISIRDVFDHRVLADLAARVEELLIAEIDALSEGEAAERLSP